MTTPYTLATRTPLLDNGLVAQLFVLLVFHLFPIENEKIKKIAINKIKIKKIKSEIVIPYFLLYIEKMFVRSNHIPVHN